MMIVNNIRVDENVVTILNMNHPKCVSDFIRVIKNVLACGYNELIIRSDVDIVFPNACVPMAGIIQGYERKGIKFAFELEHGSYLDTCSFVSPISHKDTDDLDKAFFDPFNKVYIFRTGLQIAKLSQAYINTLSHICACQTGVIDSVSWCINEVMDNVLTHSESQEGYVMAQYHPRTGHVAFCVFDLGIGIYRTLKNGKHHPQTEIDALSLAIQEGVGDGKGQGNGLYGLYASVQKNGGRLSLTSGSSSLMLTESGSISKYEYIPIISQSEKGTIIDFQININKEIDFNSVFSTITPYKVFDIRIDDMLSETDEFVHYDVFENSQGTATRESGSKIRNDVINILRRESRTVILNFSQVRAVSSSFIDEFVAKLVTELGFVVFNKIIRIEGMNENVAYLCDRSIYMRVSEEWQNRRGTESSSLS